MAGHTVCPRCGARDSFKKGYLPETCVCNICQSQLDWREIPGCGADCRVIDEPSAEASAVVARDSAGVVDAPSRNAEPGESGELVEDRGDA